MALPLPPARKKKRLLVASIGVATVSFACGHSSDRYETATSGNLLVVPIEASVDTVTVPDAGSPPSPNANPPTQAQDAGVQQQPARDAAIGEAKDAGRPVIPPSGNLLPPAPAQGKR